MDSLIILLPVNTPTKEEVIVPQPYRAASEFPSTPPKSLSSVERLVASFMFRGLAAWWCVSSSAPSKPKDLVDAFYRKVAAGDGLRN